MAKGINRAVEGVDAKIAVHICFGNLYGRPFSAVRDYRNVFPTLHELHASQIVLEFANKGPEDAERWKEFPADKELGAGVIDVKAFKAETPTDVAERIRALLKHVAPDRLWLNPDCGFWETPRWVGEAEAGRPRGGRRDRAERAVRLIGERSRLIASPGYHTVRTGYWDTSGSGLRMARPWTRAWQTSIRSNGSRCSGGKRSRWRADSSSSKRTSMPCRSRSAGTSRAGGSGRGRRPSACFRAISHAETTLR